MSSFFWGQKTMVSYTRSENVWYQLDINSLNMNCWHLVSYLPLNNVKLIVKIAIVDFSLFEKVSKFKKVMFKHYSRTQR